MKLPVGFCGNTDIRGDILDITKSAHDAHTPSGQYPWSVFSHYTADWACLVAILKPGKPAGLLRRIDYYMTWVWTSPLLFTGSHSTSHPALAEHVYSPWPFVSTNHIIFIIARLIRQGDYVFACVCVSVCVYLSPRYLKNELLDCRKL